MIKEGTMKCPYLKGTYMFSCSARREVYVPSTFEQSEYCKNMRHRVCSFFCNAEVENRSAIVSRENEEMVARW